MTSRLTLAILLVAGLGIPATARAEPAASNNDAWMIQDSAQNSMEYAKTNQTTVWQNPDTGSTGDITPVLTYQNDQGEYKGSAAYARTKRGQVILAEMWADQLADRGVTVNAMHPGWADTPGVVDSLPMFYKVTKPFLRKASEGADTIVWLAASNEAAGQSGLFWHDRRPRSTHKTRRTEERPEDRTALWQALSDLSG